MAVRRHLRSMLKTFGYWLGTAVVVIGLAFLLSLPSQDERHEANRNVKRLVDEARDNRELLCLLALRNPDNPAWNNRRVIELCLAVGVRP